MTPPQPGDKPAAFMGLAVGSLIMLVVLYGMVQWTNTRFEGHGEPAAAEATK